MKLQIHELSPQGKDRLASYLLIQTALWFFGIVGILILAAQIPVLANRKVTNVQLVNGQTIVVSQEDQLFRYPSVIKKFVSDWTMLTFNWEPKIPGTNQPDPGVRVNGSSKRVPSTTAEAALMLEPAFAPAALRFIAEEVIPPEFAGGQIKEIVVISFLSEPRQIAPGKWEVDLQSSRILMSIDNQILQVTPFNKTVTVKTAEIQRSPLGKDASLTAQRVYELRAAGLQITQLVNYNPNQ